MKNSLEPISDFLSQYGNDLLSDLKEVDVDLENEIKTIKKCTENNDINKLQQAAINGETLTKKKQLEDGWNHVCYREACVLCEMTLGVCEFNLKNVNKSMRHLDKALILGIPLTESLQKLIATVDSECKKLHETTPTSENVITTFKDDFPVVNPIVETCSEELSPEEWKSKYYNKEKPVIIRGQCKHWPAIKKWSQPSYIVNNAGWRVVPTELGRHRDGDWKEQLSTIKEFIEGKIVPQLTDSDESSVGYIAQHDLLSHLSFLKEDVSVPELALAVSDENTILSNCWIGTRNTITELHRDSYENLFVQVCGSKYIRLYAPNQAKNLYVSSGSSHAAQGNCSAVTCENEDLTAHPLHEKSEYTDCVLHPGDVLYIPSDWFHYLRALTPSASVNFWF